MVESYQLIRDRGNILQTSHHLTGILNILLLLVLLFVMRNNIAKFLHFKTLYTIGIQIIIRNHGSYLIVGQNATISCVSDSDASDIIWKQGNNVISHLQSVNRLDLSFIPVNDSIHENTYTCEANLAGSQRNQSNATANVFVTVEGSEVMF